MDCREVEKYLQAYVDGEFSENEETEIEQHFKFCPVCQKKVQYLLWFKKGMQSSLIGVRAPESMRSGLMRSIKTERRQEIPTAVKVSPAVAVMLIFFGVFFFPNIEVRSPVVEATVDRHIRQLPYDVKSTDYQQIENYLRPNIEYAIRIPRFPSRSAVLAGARVGTLREHNVAFLEYLGNGQRYSLLAAPFEQKLLEVPRSHKRKINGRELIVTRHNGFPVVVWQDGDTVYSLAGDTGEDELVHLVAQADMERKPPIAVREAAYSSH